MKNIKPTPNKANAEDAQEEARYLKDPSDLMVINAVKDSAKEAQSLIKRSKKLETENGGPENIAAFQFSEATKAGG